MELTNDYKVFIRTVFNEMRTNLEDFQKERNFLMSNPQLFTFLTYTPAVLAIACDGVVDNSEIAALEKLSRTIDVKATVNLDLTEMMSVAFEPSEVMSNEEFNIRAGSELLYLSRESQKYEKNILAALKAMLTFDMHPKSEGSMTASFSNLMTQMIENNKSTNKEAEKKKLEEIRVTLGM